MRTIPADLRLYYLQRPLPTINGMTGLQSYFPSLEQLFPSLVEQSSGTPTLAAKELALSVDVSESVIEDLQTKAQRTVNTWCRVMHLVDPVDVMSGTHVLPLDGSLPSWRTAWQQSLRKLNDPYNEAYTDAIFACMASRLVERGRSPHFCRFYGSFNGRISTYKYNITDDMGDIEGESWYREGLLSGAFKIFAVDPYDETVTAEITRPWENVRPRLFGLGDEESEFDSEVDSESDKESEKESEKESDIEVTEADIEVTEADIEVSGEAILMRPQIQLSRLGSAHRSNDSSSSSEEDDDIEYRALLPNYPVQVTVLERCDGTMDSLMEAEVADSATDDMRETKEERWTAWIFQVIAGLTVAQQLFDFVHNDLHTNNVLWTGTGETHMYYHIAGAAGGDRFYRVPTYGRIMKIIDFGRATFRPSAADGRVWFPDAYSPDSVAGGQYNCGPYFQQGLPKVSPNKSFDLCRLAVSILDTLWPTEPASLSDKPKILTRETGRTQVETVSPLWNLLWLWLTDKHGKNVLRSPDGSERYPNFDLYCAIAKDVHNAVPAQQLTLPLFDSVFRIRRKDIPSDAPIWKLQWRP